MYILQVTPQKNPQNNDLEILQSYSIWAKYLVRKITVQMLKNS